MSVRYAGPRARPGDRTTEERKGKTGMLGTTSLSAEAIDMIVLAEKNDRLEFMDQLIGNAERHGEDDVAVALARTMDEMTTV